ncbi:hypothetical protein [uncultured Cohaesibacter sp.]|uniref:COG4223 family protein n=1 Tax=uncultured Cohaesibacter sp. TaxID=1002546 RepID=UPI0029C7BF09|nr:hypothetical protein [uncultured Cohaesibacter sp.]
MTTRKSNNRTAARGKPVKTIDLTAEDVTKAETPMTPEAENTAAAERAETSATDAVKSEATDIKVDADTVPASDGPAENAEGKDPLDEEARSAVEETAPVADDGDKATDAADAVASETAAGAEDSGGDSGAPPASAAPAASVAPINEAPKSGGFGGGFVGGLLGGVAIVALGYVGLQQGWMTLPSETTKIDTLQTQVTALDGKLSALPSVDAAAISQQLEALSGRLDALEAKAAGLTTDGTASGEASTDANGSGESDAPVTSNSPVGLQLEALAGRIDALKESLADIDGLKTDMLDAKAQLAALASQLAEQGSLIETKAAEQAAQFGENLQAAKDDILSSADRRINDVVVELSNFSDKITAEAKSLSERVTALEENNLSERMQSSARTIALAGLENATASGANFELALKTFANVVGDHDAVKALQAYAATGVPTARALAADFRAKYDDILREAEGAGATTILDKFLISAQSMVKVHSLTGEQKGESLVSQLGVIEFHVKQGNLVKAAEEWDALPEAARVSKAGAGWIEGLKARIAVDAAMDTIRTDFGSGAKNTAG